MGFHHEVRVRYGEADMQGVVFNANYLAYVDDAVTRWLEACGLGYPIDDLSFDFMVRHAEIDWVGSATFNDLVEIECEVTRWGTTSFDVTFELHVGDKPVCTVVLTYVGIEPGTADTKEVPAVVRERLGG